MTFTRESIAHFFNNRARNGGAILATESTITMFGETTIANNMATMANGSGGGISLKQSCLDIREECQIVNNVATRGGGIHASSSTIVVHPSGTLRITSNTAKLGGGIYLKVNPKLYILKNGPDLTGDIINDDARNYLIIDGNHANYGGALYVADDTNSGACLSDNECFIQKLALYISSNYSLFTLNSEYTVSIRFSKNTAIVQGSDLFGGLLDRCIPSPFAEYSKPNYLYSSGVAYLETISNIALDSTHSHPVRICFCNSNHEPDCSYQPPVIRVLACPIMNVSSKNWHYIYLVITPHLQIQNLYILEAFDSLKTRLQYKDPTSLEDYSTGVYQVRLLNTPSQIIYTAVVWLTLKLSAILH